MIHRLTQPSRAVLVEAQSLVTELGSSFLETGHILYGCATVQDETAKTPLAASGITPASVRRRLPAPDPEPVPPVDTAALNAVGIDYQSVRQAVERNFGVGALETAPDRRAAPAKRERPGSPPFSANAKMALELSARVSNELAGPDNARSAKGDAAIRPGHLLLALLRLDDELIWDVIEDAGSSVASVSAAVLARLAAEE